MARRSPPSVSERRAWGRSTARWTLALTLFLVALAPNAAAADASSLGSAAAADPATRPYEAPAFAKAPIMPPVPPEYLSHDEAGVRFLYHPSARDRVRGLIDEAELTRAELRHRLGVDVLPEVDVRVAVGSADFSRVLPDGAPRGSSVIAFSQSSTLALNLGAGAAAGSADVRAAFRRGLAHLALDEASAARALPRWFRVGFAIDFSGEAQLSRGRALWWASMRQRLVPVVDLDHFFADQVAYDSVAAAEAADFVGFLQSDERAEHFHELLTAVRGDPQQGFEAALHAAYQQDRDQLEMSWRGHMARHKAFLPILFGGTGLWMLLGLVVTLRRRIREPAKASRPERSVVHVAVAAKEPEAAPRPRKRPPPKAEPPEPDVPKVSHNGRWHTLH